MNRHLPQQPRGPGQPPIPAADFDQLPSVLPSREAANVLRVGVREVRALVDSGQLARGLSENNGDPSGIRTALSRQ